MNKEIKKKLLEIGLNYFKMSFVLKLRNLKNSAKFVCKKWKKIKKKNEGGGEYRILQNGKIFEKGGVAFSEVSGKFLKRYKKKIPGNR